METKGANFIDKENAIAEIIFHVMVKNNNRVLCYYHGKSKLFTYLWPIVRNKIIDLIREERRYHSIAVQQENLEEIISEQSNSPGTAETIFEEHLQAEKPLDKFIKYAKWMQELSYDEIIKIAKKEFPESKSLNTQRIAYVLHTNRKELQKKLKKFAV